MLQPRSPELEGREDCEGLQRDDLSPTCIEMLEEVSRAARRHPFRRHLVERIEDGSPDATATFRICVDEEGRRKVARELHATLEVCR